MDAPSRRVRLNWSWKQFIRSRTKTGALVDGGLAFSPFDRLFVRIRQSKWRCVCSAGAIARRLSNHLFKYTHVQLPITTPPPCWPSTRIFKQLSFFLVSRHRPLVFPISSWSLSSNFGPFVFCSSCSNHLRSSICTFSSHRSDTDIGHFCKFIASNLMFSCYFELSWAKTPPKLFKSWLNCDSLPSSTFSLFEGFIRTFSYIISHHRSLLFSDCWSQLVIA